MGLTINRRVGEEILILVPGNADPAEIRIRLHSIKTISQARIEITAPRVFHIQFAEHAGRTQPPFLKPGSWNLVDRHHPDCDNKARQTGQ